MIWGGLFCEKEKTQIIIVIIIMISLAWDEGWER